MRDKTTSTTPGYDVLTASEADRLYAFQPGTVRKAISDGRVQSRKSAGTRLVTVAALHVCYGPPSQEALEAFIASHLTQDDLAAWQDGGRIGSNLQTILDALGLEAQAVKHIDTGRVALGQSRKVSLEGDAL